MSSQAILGSRQLREHVKSVLYIDDKNYENPQDYVRRNRYFFTSDLPAAVSEEGSISIDDLQRAVSEMMTPLSASVPETPKASTGITCLALKEKLDQSTSTYAAAIEAACLEQVSGEGEEATALLKTWRASIHRYLREKLLFGLPGPGNSQVMAVLGYRECCRRLGIE